MHKPEMVIKIGKWFFWFGKVKALSWLFKVQISFSKRWAAKYCS